MSEIAEAQRMLEQIIGHLKAGTRTDTRQAAAKWGTHSCYRFHLGTRAPNSPVE